MSQVSSGELCLLSPSVDLLLESVEATTKGRVDGGYGGEGVGQPRAANNGVGSREEKRAAQSGGSQPVAMAGRDSFDHPVQPQSPQVIAHTAGGNLLGRQPQQLTPMLTQITVGKDRKSVV